MIFAYLGLTLCLLPPYLDHRLEHYRAAHTVGGVGEFALGGGGVETGVVVSLALRGCPRRGSRRGRVAAPARQRTATHRQR